MLRKEDQRIRSFLFLGVCLLLYGIDNNEREKNYTIWNVWLLQQCNKCQCKKIESRCFFDKVRQNSMEIDSYLDLLTLNSSTRYSVFLWVIEVSKDILFFSFNFIVPIISKRSKTITQLIHWSFENFSMLDLYLVLYLVTVANNRYLLLLVVFFKSNWTKFSQTKRHFHANLDFVFVSLIKNFLF